MLRKSVPDPLTLGGKLTITGVTSGNAVEVPSGSRIAVGSGYVTWTAGTMSYVAGGGSVHSFDQTLQTTNGNLKASSGSIIAVGGVYTDASNSTMSVRGNSSNGASGIGVKFGNFLSFTTVGSKIAAFYSDNLSTEKLAVSKDGKLVYPSSGAADVRGTATLVGGTVTVNTTAVEAGDLIFVSRNTAGGTVGHLNAPTSTITAATSFVINSSSGTDTSTVNWWIVK